MSTVNLWCQGGSHFWDREAKRGRKPLSCPEHLTVQAPVRAPGLKAVESPKVEEPAPQEAEQEPTAPPVDALAKAREAKAQKAAQKDNSTASLVRKALTTDTVPDELKRKITYVEDQLQVRVQDGFLLKVRKELLREAKVA